MKLQGFVGPAYTLESVNVDAQRAVNLYPEIIESGTGKGANQYYYKSTPGLDEILDIGSGEVRLVHYDYLGRCFIVIGDTLYKVTYSSGWQSTSLGTFSTSTGDIKAASAKTSAGFGETTFVDGTHMYAYSYTGSDNFGLYSGFGYTEVATATEITWIDGYYICNELDTGTFHVSDLGSPNFSTLSFASSEGNPDNIVTLIENQRSLVILNEQSTEVYINTGNSDFPFERVQSGFIERGCVAPSSLAKVKNVLFWLGRDAFGHGIVYAMSGYTPERISTHAIEQKIKSYADITTCRAFCYQDNGHEFYVLNFAEATWVYDLSTGLWHERAYSNNGALERARPNTHAFFPSQGVHILGDYTTNKVYIYNDGTYTDNGVEITRLRTCPHLSNENYRVFLSRLWVDIQIGVGLNSGQGVEPEIMLDWSDDGGYTWSDENWKNIGALGEYNKRVYWNRLGSFRDRIFRFKITDPVKVTLIGAYLEVQIGKS